MQKSDRKQKNKKNQWNTISVLWKHNKNNTPLARLTKKKNGEITPKRGNTSPTEIQACERIYNNFMPTPK